MSYREDLRAAVRAALREDVGTGDVTTLALIPQGETATADMIAKQPGVLCGLDAAAETFAQVDRKLRFRRSMRDGAEVRIGDRLARIQGRLRSVLIGERVALNFLQQLSGVATLTRAFVEKTRGTRAKIYDTRKTIPGLRVLQKRAVTVGGGCNHRMGLFDGGLIKDNHLAVADDLEGRVRALRKRARWIQIEASTPEEALYFARLPVDAILLDNFPPRVLSGIVRQLRKQRPRLELEASGGITLTNVQAIARAGVDRISVGALTHSAPALDISLEVSE